MKICEPSAAERVQRAANWITAEALIMHGDSWSAEDYIIGHLAEAGLLAGDIDQEKMLDYIEKRARGEYDRVPPTADGGQAETRDVAEGFRVSRIGSIDDLRRAVLAIHD